MTHLRYACLFLFLAVSSIAFSQTIYKGKVVDKATLEPIIGAIITIETPYVQRISTNVDGIFHYKSSARPKISISYIGYKTLTVMADTNAIYKLESSIRSLAEVVVTAQEAKTLATSSIIKQHAMEHLQPSTFADVLELLPGGRASNNSIATPQTIQLRQVPIASNDYNTSSLGTRFVIDGSPMSTNANMQHLSGALDRTSTHRDFTNSGVDMRSIATDDIQEVEIIRGVPSVKYGDLTSGLVHIKRKKGGHDLSARFKADMSSKLYYVGKGFEWQEHHLSLNISADYLDAQVEPRNLLENYKRLTFSTRLNKQLRLKNYTLNTSFNVDYSGSFDDEKQDEELNYGGVDKYVSKYNRYASAIRAEFTSDNANLWLKNAEFSTSLSYERDELERTRLVQLQGDTPAAVTDKEGESDAVFIYPYTYVASQSVDGRPISLFVNANTTFSVPSEKVENSLLVGLDYQIDKNLGDGQRFNKLFPLYPETFNRPRKYSEVPASKELSFYVEESVKWHLGSHRFNTVVGTRLQTMQGLSRNYAMSGRYYIDPRLNVSYSLPSFYLGNQQLNFTLSAGWGQHTKFPTIEQLYPERQYIDFAEFSFYHEQREHRRMRLQTYVIDPTNISLEPARNTKWELRGDVSFAGNRLTITYFEEDMTSGFRTMKHYLPYIYKHYTMKDVTIDQFVNNPNIDALPFVTKTRLKEHNVLGNGSRIFKKGIEYTFTTARMPLFNTRLTINGAWFKTLYKNAMSVEQKPSRVINGKSINVVGIYNDDEGYIKEMLNTNFTLDSTIPSLNLGISLSAQCLWLTASQSMSKDAYPHSYIDERGKVNIYTDIDAKDAVLSSLKRSLSDVAFERQVVPFSMNVNLKATKKLWNNKLMVALFINKLWDAYPEYTRHNVTFRRYVTPYFGLETNVKL